MNQPSINFTVARTHMVDSQVRPNKVTNPALIAAMREVPRERFLPAGLAALAYADEDVPLGGGRVMLEPMVIARLLQVASPREGEAALVVAAGAGYGATLLSRLGAGVTALEEDADLLALARPALAAMAPEVSLAAGSLAAGWPASAPYTLILVEGAVEEVPAALTTQLAEGGRILAIRRTRGIGQAIMGRMIGGQIAWSVLFDCATPVIPSLKAAPGFVF